MPARPHLARVVAALTLLACASLARAGDRPHIVYVMPDDLGWQDLGYLGKEIRTPNIDALADDSVRLSQFYVQSHSSQTRAALMTGRYPMRYGLQTMSILPQSQYGLPVEERTLATTTRHTPEEFSARRNVRLLLRTARPTRPLRAADIFDLNSLLGNPYGLPRGRVLQRICTARSSAHRVELSLM